MLANRTRHLKARHLFIRGCVSGGSGLLNWHVTLVHLRSENPETVFDSNFNYGSPWGDYDIANAFLERYAVVALVGTVRSLLAPSQWCLRLGSLECGATASFLPTPPTCIPVSHNVSFLRCCNKCPQTGSLDTCSFNVLESRYLKSEDKCASTLT